MIRLIAHQLLLTAILFDGVLGQPDPVWQWQNPLPQGDDIRQVLFVNPSRGWAVLKSRGLLHTSDGGGSWRLVLTNVSLWRVSFINETRGWGIGSDYAMAEQSGVYHTTDGGVTWAQQIPDSSFPGTFRDIKFTDENRGWAIREMSIWHTTSGGQAWQEQAGSSFVRPSNGDHTIVFRDSLHGWAGGWRSFASVTSNGGRTWARDSSLEGYNRFNFLDSAHGWASSTFESWRRRAIARTDDGGRTWQQTLMPLYGLAFPSSDKDCIAFADSGVFKTTDAGNSWYRVNTHVFRDGYIQNHVAGWAYEYSRNRLFFTTDGGFSWNDQPKDAFGSGYTTLVAVEFVDTSFGWVVGLISNPPSTETFIARTTDGGATWAKIYNAFTSRANGVSFSSRSIGWVVGNSGMIQMTKDGGRSWEPQTSGVYHALWDVQFVSNLVGYAVGYATDGVIVKTTDGGANWMNVSPPSLWKLESLHFVDELHGWVCGDLTSSDPAVFLRTTDGGANWEDPLLDSTLRFDRVWFVNQQTGWAKGGSPSRVMKTTDGGSTWTSQRTATVGTTLEQGGIAFHDSLRGWVTGYYGIMWFTSDGGNTWQNKTGATSNWMRGIAVAGSDRVWFVGWQSAILTCRSDGTVFVSEHQPPAPLPALRVSQNYPNPFNSQTTLEYLLPQAGEVVVDLYDTLGQLVRRIRRGHEEVGTHTLVIDAQGLASGVYFYRIAIGHRNCGGTMVLIR